MKNVFCIVFLMIHSVVIFAQTDKQFIIYDAIAYAGKPDLSAEGISPVFLIYEGYLTKPDSDRSSVLDSVKVNIFAKAAADYFPHVMVSTDIERCFWDNKVGPDEMKTIFGQLFQTFRSYHHGVYIGNYAIAPMALCVHRFYRQELFPEPELISRWKASNQKIWAVVEYADMVQPTVYIAEPNIKSWIDDLRTTVSEIKLHAPGKKIIPYIWPQYYNKPESPYNRKVVSPVIWQQMLDALYDLCDGAIIWSSITGADDKPLLWTNPAIQEIWDVTQKFIQVHRENIVSPVSNDALCAPKSSSSQKTKIHFAIERKNMPDLSQYGIHKCKILREEELGQRDTNNIYRPDPIKISEQAKLLAKTPNIPVYVYSPSWLKDLSSDSLSTQNRFATVRKIFKQNNKRNQLCFAQVAPKNLNENRSNNSNFFVVFSSWLLNSAISTRSLREYTDVLLADAYIMDDDTVSWKRDFNLTIRELKQQHSKKPIYVTFRTTYHSMRTSNANFGNPIKASTWNTMLKTASNQCDGIIIYDMESKDIAWDDDANFWKTTKAFIQTNRKKIIFP